MAVECEHVRLSQADCYSVVLPEKLSDNVWNVHRSSRFPSGLITTFLSESGISSLFENFQFAIARYADRPFLGTRVRPDGSIGKYEWLSYLEAGEARTAIGSGLIHSGVSKGSRIGLYFINRPEWVIIEQACYAYGFISVPLYDTLGPDTAKYILNHAEVSALFCTRDELTSVANLLPQCPSLQLIIVIGGNEQLLPSSPPNSPCSLVHYTRVEALGRSRNQPFSPSDAHEPCTICYTSGTTGIPKGALLSQANILASSAGALTSPVLQPADVSHHSSPSLLQPFRVQQPTPLLETTIHISYLPLAHIYERVNVQCLIHLGAAIGFYQGDVLKLLEDMEELRPTVFTSVPRLYNRIYDRVLATVRSSSPLRQYLFNTAYQSKKHAIERGYQSTSIWDRLIFDKIKAKLGGRVRVMITGASPISKEVLLFLRICFGAKVVEGYGMTESCSGAAATDLDDTQMGHVGSPLPSCEIKLEDVPEMNYTHKDMPYPRGEICLRGPSVFKGYYKDPQQTKEVLDDEGWLHTGDIGMWGPGGRLQIIDRKKNIFKLAQGEYIAPEKIENVYLRSPFVTQCFVHGNSLNSQLIAIVVPDTETLTAWAKGKGMNEKVSLEVLCKELSIVAVVLADMHKCGQKAQLQGFEQVKAIHLSPEPFAVENGLLTPTFKTKRPQARAYFEKEIESLYGRLHQQALASQVSLSRL